MSQLVPTTDESTWYSTAAADGGACCNSKTAFVTQIGTVSPSYTVGAATLNV